jgi:hypothetical protein
MDIIINTLEKYIKKTEVNKSSYWKEALKNKNFKNIYSELGFGSFTEIIFFKSILHYILSRICYSNFIFKTQYFYKIKNTFLKINRQIDNDTIRHLFTFNLIKKKIKFQNAAVIGDGKANFLLQYLILFPKKKIYSINLAETLMHDYLILKKHKIISTKLIKVVQKQKDLGGEHKVYLIPSNNKNLLLKKKIDLFINIDSFQEMNNNEIHKYFKIIKSQKTFLYHCNREYKKLPCGEELVFKNYPYGIKFNNFKECPWEKRYYSFAYPFIHKYDGKHLHTLIDFKKKNKII